VAEVEVKHGFHINSYWGRRPETPAQIAARCRDLLEKLAAISPIFTGWTYVGWKDPPPNHRYQGPRALDEYYRDRTQTFILGHPSSIDLTPLIASGVAHDDDEPDPDLGYSFSVFTRSGDDPNHVSLRVRAANLSPAKFYTNGAIVETQPLCPENQPWQTFSTFRAVMLAIAETCDVTWAAIYPTDLMELWPKPYRMSRPTFKLAWVTYLSPRFAPLITPPRGALVEYTPQGGIVMVATRDRFYTANPLHVAAARRIEAAVAPVNALPWPPDALPA
jgi:hypothetical protein